MEGLMQYVQVCSLRVVVGMVGCVVVRATRMQIINNFRGNSGLRGTSIKHYDHNTCVKDFP